jgi:nucleotide-binding universal stress UspA family protein
MRMFKHLLVPVDGSELAEHAVSESVALARRLGARITAFVAEPPSPAAVTGYGASNCMRTMEEHGVEAAEHAQAVISEFRSRAEAAGVAFEGVYTRSPEVDAAIVEAARCRGCDLIVMATHGRGVFGELLFGSRTRDVLARSELPLLVLH